MRTTTMCTRLACVRVGKGAVHCELIHEHGYNNTCYIMIETQNTHEQGRRREKTATVDGLSVPSFAWESTSQQVTLICRAYDVTNPRIWVQKCTLGTKCSANFIIIRLKKLVF